MFTSLQLCLGRALQPDGSDMYAKMPKQLNSNTMVDLRSDTVTRPSEGMRLAMAQAEVGDDVYGDDPTVSALEEKAAALLGKEAGLFVASGTQSNLCALLSHCGRGDEYIGGLGYHIPTYEAGGAAVLGGISPRHLRPMANGCLDPVEIEASIQPDDPHFAMSRLLCLENTFNGRVQDQAAMTAAADVAQRHGLLVHVDGARLMNAAVASGTQACDLVSFADTVSLCLSKGLGAPVGSVLCGPADFIVRARRNRKLLGGGMRQAGVLAACGLYALDNNIERLADDHANARELAERLNSMDGLVVDLETTQTNMIWLKIDATGRGPLSAHMLEHGIIMSDPSGEGQAVARLVTHMDFESRHADSVVDGFASWLD